ncbi:hypothetical protein [uncultured Rothia sp.]|uniref:hypothetical protein n=1 Tax=uncultured Rothia sp. TaxID=316088 RepID=UPI00321684DA
MGRRRNRRLDRHQHARHRPGSSPQQRAGNGIRCKNAPLGWLAEDGVPIETSTDSQKFKAMQGSATIKTKITSLERNFQVQALEENLQVTSLYWANGKPEAVAADETLMDIPNTMKTLNCWAILSFVDGEYWKIYVFPSVDITDRGTLDHKNSDLSIYQMTADIRKAGWMITNNPSYQEGMTESEKADFSAADDGKSILEG